MENELLEMSKDFKHRIAQKNKENAEMKRALCIVYGILKSGIENNDIFILENGFDYVITLIESIFDME